MSNATIGLPADGTGKLMDAESLTVGSNTVYRERVQITGTAATDIAPVSSSVGVSVNPAALSKDIDAVTVYPTWGKNTWAQGDAPAVNTIAVTSKAAAGAGFRHVCTGITVTLSASGTAPTAARCLVLLRDGATGAGTVLWAATLSLPNVAGQNAPSICLSGLAIRGSENTAMTLEFTAAGGAQTFQVVALQGAIEAI